MTLRIGFLSSDFSLDVSPALGTYAPGGCLWYRGIVPWTTVAAEADVTFAWAGRAATLRSGEIALQHDDGAVVGGHDVIIVQRWMNEGVDAMIRDARRYGQVVLQDIDDLFLEIPPSNQAFRDTDPRVNPKANRRNYARAVRASDGIIASTPYLAGRYRKLNPNVVVCRNALDMARWGNPNLLPDRTELVVGWMGSTTHRGGDLEILRHIGGELRPGEVFAHVGHHEDRPHLTHLAGIAPERMMVAPPCPVYRVQDAIGQFDIGVVPLTSIPFNKAKSSLKAQEFAALGIPAIASRTPENEHFAVAELVDNTPGDWAAALDRLRDDDYRRDLGDRALARAVALSIGNTWKDWLGAIESFL